MTSTKTTNEPSGLERTLEIANVLHNRKAEQIVALDLQGVSSLCDYFLVVTATSEPHLNALSENLARHLKNEGHPALRISGNAKSGWVVVDTFDVIVHMMTEPLRETYALEELWKDAEPVTLELS